MAWSKRSRSASSAAMIDCVSKGVLPIFKMAMILQENRIGTCRVLIYFVNEAGDNPTFKDFEPELVLLGLRRNNVIPRNFARSVTDEWDSMIAAHHIKDEQPE